jgi:hypothetical protein
VGELLEVLPAIGFRGVELRERFDAFRGTSKERLARKYDVMGVNVLARRP